MTANKMLLSTNEVCKRLGISRNTLWRMEKLGQIPAAVRIGSLKRWRSEDFSQVGVDIAVTVEPPPRPDKFETLSHEPPVSGRSTISIRFPDGMRPAIARVARQNGVSANSEISRRILLAPTEFVAGPLSVARGDDAMVLRIPHADRAMLEAAGRSSQRSLSSEIVRRLASSLDADDISWRALSHASPEREQLGAEKPAPRWRSRRGDHQLKVRLPDEAFERLKSASAANGRTMNAEMIDRLQTSFDVQSSPDLTAVLLSIDARLKRLEDQ